MTLVSWHDFEISQSLFAGLFNGDGTLSNEVETPNSYTYNIAYNRILASSFANKVLVHVNDLPELSNTPMHYYEPDSKPTTCYTLTGHRDAITAMVRYIHGYPLLPHRLALIQQFVGHWGISLPDMQHATDSLYVAGWALSDGYICLKPNTFSPEVQIIASQEHLPYALGKYWESIIPNSRLEMATNGSSVIHILRNKEVLANILLLMAHAYYPCWGPQFITSITAFTLVMLTGILWRPGGHGYGSDRRYIVSALAFVLGYALWYFKVEYYGGLLCLSVLPLIKDSERHYRDPDVHRSMGRLIKLINTTFQQSTNLLQFIDLLTQAVGSMRNLYLWY